MYMFTEILIIVLLFAAVLALFFRLKKSVGFSNGKLAWVILS